MCFGGGKSAPTPQVQPAPAPIPVPTPSEISPQSAEEKRRKQLDLLRYGLASTIKTSGRGITGTGPNLSAASLYGKDKLGT